MNPAPSNRKSGVSIAVIDYNAGNIASVGNALRKLGFEYTITKDPKEILAADKVIFPGQGRAAAAMDDLRASGLDKVIREIKKPFLGICLGLQLLFESSEEDDAQCLGIIEGRVKRFNEPDLKIPQMGWNIISIVQNDPLISCIPDKAYVYFANSYYGAGDNYALATSVYGSTESGAIIRKDNFYGTQFHPEKSGEWGMKILDNFCRL